MKAILVSVPPEVCARIVNGEQTVLLMKRIPKLDAPYRVYMYCTSNKGAQYLVRKDGMLQNLFCFGGIEKDLGAFNSKVIGSFVCEKVDEFRCCFACYKRYNNFEYDSFIDNGIYQIDGDNGVVFERPDTRVDSMLKNNDLSRMCMTAQDLYRKIGVGNRSCALHITDLTIFDKPKELGEFKTVTRCKDLWCFDMCSDVCGYVENNQCDYGMVTKRITCPPATFCYVEGLSE